MRFLWLIPGLLAGLAVAGAVETVLAAGKAGDDVQFNRSGNWSRATQGAPQAGEDDGTGAGDVPIPRPKPGSAAARRAAEEDKAAQPDTSSQPAKPRARPKKQAATGETGFTGGTANTSAPFRGQLSSDEIKELLSGRALSAKVGGKPARISLVEGGTLTWRSSDGTSGEGRWWTEQGRICDRYDPAGDFPGRGAGCRSFEQKSDGVYIGGKRIDFAN